MDYLKFLEPIGITPYPYQVTLASQEWPDLIEIPTGLGKTAAVILAWLYKRSINDPDTPRRLVYCLPMCTLVEQTKDRAEEWIDTLKTSNFYQGIDANRIPKVFVLMGGNIDRDWDQLPEQDMILIGTQDQLLSRALNRGYAISRYRWPIQFGLLHNDALWVMDEVQLMGNGLATTTQLEAFRRLFKTIKPVKSIWMSATINKEWLATINFKDKIENLKTLFLSGEDWKNPRVLKRMQAEKPVIVAEGKDEKGEPLALTEPELVKKIIAEHRGNSRTLVIVNTVARAVDLYEKIKKKVKKEDIPVFLLHSRFRQPERERHLENFLRVPPETGMICVATQVVEAGVDISAKTLFTDTAPWCSLVQRFGRCNRYGDDNDARIFWIRPKPKNYLPYEKNECVTVEQISKLGNTRLDNLPRVTEKLDFTSVLRKPDLLDLFDTSEDISGLDTDVSRYIRDIQDKNIFVFWREQTPSNYKQKDIPAPGRDELCPVSIGLFYGSEINYGWVWDALTGKWERKSRVVPGQTVMLSVKDGGYSSELGWTGKKKDKPSARFLLVDDSYGKDHFGSSKRETISSHTDKVVNELEKLIRKGLLATDKETFESDLLMAARWHDVGKVHPVCQQAFEEKAAMSLPDGEFWAKTDAERQIRYKRRYFRHELASALALLQSGQGSSLAVYLVAAHHGKVRVSVQNMPDEKPPRDGGDPDRIYARGVCDGDLLPAVNLGGGVMFDGAELDLKVAMFGRNDRNCPSWTETVKNIINELGPFKLAYLEALLRIADWKASSTED